MYLAKRKIRSKGFVTGYNCDDLKRARLPIEILEQKVILLRSGDKSVVDDIAVSHLGLVISIVGRYVSFFPKQADDLMGVGQLKLVECINNFSVNGKDNNITPYIITCIHGALGVFLQRDNRLIKLKSNDYKKAIKESQDRGVPLRLIIGDFETMNTKPYHENPEEDELDKDLETSSRLQILDDQSGMETAEIVDSCCPTRFHMLVCKGLMEGNTESNIAREIGKSKQRVNDIKLDILRKLTVHLLMQEAV